MSCKQCRAGAPHFPKVLQLLGLRSTDRRLLFCGTRNMAPIGTVAVKAHIKLRNIVDIVQ
jgi:hypothetical protein